MSATEWKASLVTQRNSTNRRVGVPLIRQTPDLSFRFSNKVVYLFSLEKLISKKYIEISSSMILNDPTWIKKRSFITEDLEDPKQKRSPSQKDRRDVSRVGFERWVFHRWPGIGAGYQRLEMVSGAREERPSPRSMIR